MFTAKTRPSIGLEKRAAEIFGREAALFVPSGTMGNQIAIKLHTHHGQEVICEERGHVFNYEMAMMAHFSGVVPRTVWAEDGILTWEHVKSKLKTKSYHAAKTGLVSLENTHNIAGGTITPLAVFDEVCDNAHEAGLPVHLDGARVFNASVALGIPVAQLTAKADTVMFCLSKGLGAPVGSLAGGQRRTDGPRPHLSQGAGRRHAAGRDSCCRRPDRAGAGAAETEAGPRQCALPRRRAGGNSRHQDRSRQGADQHPDMRHQRHRHELGQSCRTSWPNTACWPTEWVRNLSDL